MIFFIFDSWDIIELARTLTLLNIEQSLSQLKRTYFNNCMKEDRVRCQGYN